MTPTERVAIEAIALLPGVPDDARRLLNNLASGRRPGAPLREDGEPVNPNTRRWRAYQERRRQRAGGEPLEDAPANGSNAEPTPSNADANALANGPANALQTVGAPPDPPEISPSFSDLVPSERGSETRVRAAANAGQTPPQTPSQTPVANAPADRPRATNTTGDGCFGDAVKAWAAGVESVTKKRFQLPRPGSLELAKLVDALVDGEEDLAKRESWARAQGEAFARARAGKTLNAHSFVDWLNSDEKPPAALADVEAKKRAEARADDADRERKDYLAKAAPPSPEVAAALAAALAKRA